VAVALAFACSDAAVAWEFAHGDPANSGFANVTTAPAGAGSVTVPGLGTFIPGAGPVIAPDGTVYLGTRQGKLIALHPDGKPFWSRDIAGQSIVASPAVASDGSIYVVGVDRTRDPSGDPAKQKINSILHRFSSSGAWLAQIPFPAHGGMGPAAVSPPNILKLGGTEAIMVPVSYPSSLKGRPMVRLVAFTPEGQVLDDAIVWTFGPDITGGVDWDGLVDLIPHVDYNPPKASDLMKVPPMPGVAIGTDNGNTIIAASDHHKDLVGFSFTDGRFAEVFRLHQEDFFMRTAPAISGTRVLIGLQETADPKTQGRLLSTTFTASRSSQVDGVGAMHASPTRLADGRVVLVSTRGQITVLKSNNKVAATLSAPGRSMASAAASRNHFFVSSENGFVTFDAASVKEVSRVDWVGGGLNPPAIGPKGHVYAIASNILFVFPPPKLGNMTTQQPQSGLTIAPNPQAAAAPEKEYKPPMTAGGNRLFACEELDQDDCGKGDHKDISLAWCQKQGYPQVKQYDVDSEKVKAETLDGRFCSKNKCKVFEQIVCAQ
jgi:hypothetical protein